MFPSVSQSKETILAQTQFFNNMSKPDLVARKAPDAQTYQQRYIDALTEFTIQEKTLVSTLVSQANRMMKPLKNLHAIPWKFAKLCCHIEDSYPHTLADTIFLPDAILSSSVSPERLLKVLIHEKVHIYQRKYKLYSQLLITKYWHFDILAVNNKENPDFTLLRNNPDINSIIYAKDEKLCLMRYENSEPVDIGNAKISGQCPDNYKYEHPYEAMAYIISDAIVGDADPNTTFMYLETLGWLNRYG